MDIRSNILEILFINTGIIYSGIFGVAMFGVLFLIFSKVLKVDKRIEKYSNTEHKSLKELMKEKRQKKKENYNVKIKIMETKLNMISEFFTGREDTIINIKNEFQNSNVVAITGESGIGKTQTALKFISNYKAEYEHIAFINAESLISILCDFSLCLKKDVDENTLTIFNLWMEKNTNWLIVLDNLQDDFIQKNLINNILKNIQNGNILITSTLTNWENKILIESFTENEAIQFLIKSTGIEDTPAASKLAKELGYFPLSLEYSSKYIKNTKSHFDKYCERLSKFTSYKTEDHFKNTRSFIFSKTWQISLEQILEKSSIEILYLLSFYDSNDIPLNLFKAGEKYLPDNIKTSMESSFNKKKMFSTLSDYSFLTVNNTYFNINSLIQDSVRDSLEHHKWCYFATDVMRKAFSFNLFRKETWKQTFELASHAIKVIQHSEELNIQNNNLDLIYTTLAEIYKFLAFYYDAEIYFLKAIDCKEVEFGKEHLHTANMYRELAEIYKIQDNIEQAENYYSSALNVYEKKHGVNHLDTADTFNDLGEIYLKQEKIKQAEEYFLKALSPFKNKLGVENPKTITLYENLILIYENSNNNTEIEKYLNIIYDAKEDKLGKNHIETLKTGEKLAALLINQGKFSAAKEKLEKIRTQYEKKSNHPNLASVYENLGLILKTEGKYKDAKDLFQKSIKIHKDKNNQQSLFPIYENLADLFSIEGKHKEAEEYLLNALKIKETTYGKNHHLTAATYNNLGILYKSMNKLKEANDYFLLALDIFKSKYGSNHSDTLTIQDNIEKLKTAK